MQLVLLRGKRYITERGVQVPATRPSISGLGEGFGGSSGDKASTMQKTGYSLRPRLLYV